MKNKETVLVVNNIDIISLTDYDEPLIPIKPICDALGIAFAPQFSKIKEDPDLSSVVTLSVMTGSDGKSYKMQCLPLEFVYGWLFTINPKNVKEESREGLRKYRMECYRALYSHFNDARKFLKHKQEIIAKENAEMKKIRLDFAFAKKRLDEKKESMDKAFQMTIDDWRKNNEQLGLRFSEEFREDFEE